MDEGRIDRSIDRTHFGALRRNGPLGLVKFFGASFARLLTVRSLIPTSSIRSDAAAAVVSKDNCRSLARPTVLKGLPPAAALRAWNFKKNEAGI